MYVAVNEDGRICSTTSVKEYTDDRYFEFEFPENFDFGTQFEYRIVNSVLVHDPLPPSEEELEDQSKMERRKQLDLAATIFVRINAKTFSNNEALEVSMLFSEWRPNTKYEKDDIIRHDGDIYRIGQDHTSQQQWIPGETGTESLYSLIHIDEGGYETWKKWDGISGLYKQGQVVRDPDDGKLYESKIPNNIWGPPHEQPTYWELYEE